MFCVRGAQRLWERERGYWESTVKPCVDVMAAMCPSVLPRVDEVTEILSNPESFSPYHITSGFSQSNLWPAPGLLGV